MLADERSPFRVRRDGNRFELLHYIGDHVDLYVLSALNLITLKQDATAAADGLLLNTIMQQAGCPGASLDTADPTRQG
jgi:hypothetical protein